MNLALPLSVLKKFSRTSSTCDIRAFRALNRYEGVSAWLVSFFLCLIQIAAVIDSYLLPSTLIFPLVRAHNVIQDDTKTFGNIVVTDHKASEETQKKNGVRPRASQNCELPYYTWHQSMRTGKHWSHFAVEDPFWRTWCPQLLVEYIQTDCIAKDKHLDAEDIKTPNSF